MITLGQMKRPLVASTILKVRRLSLFNEANGAAWLGHLAAKADDSLSRRLGCPCQELRALAVVFLRDN